MWVCVWTIVSFRNQCDSSLESSLIQSGGEQNKFYESSDFNISSKSFLSGGDIF